MTPAVTIFERRDMPLPPLNEGVGDSLDGTPTSAWGSLTLSGIFQLAGSFPEPLGLFGSDIRSNPTDKPDLIRAVEHSFRIILAVECESDLLSNRRIHRPIENQQLCVTDDFEGVYF